VEALLSLQVVSPQHIERPVVKPVGWVIALLGQPLYSQQNTQKTTSFRSGKMAENARMGSFTFSGIIMNRFEEGVGSVFMPGSVVVHLLVVLRSQLVVSSQLSLPGKVPQLGTV